MEATAKRLFSDAHANVFVTPLPSGKLQVHVEKRERGLFVPFDCCKTSYSVPLINTILSAKGPAYLIDEILRDESPGYVQHDLKWSILSYVSHDRFAGKRILDFGCGSGASAVTLARMFPNTEIVGIELEGRLLNVARARARFYDFKNIAIHVSPAPNQLPEGIGSFDFVVLSAVYEHLLPNERKALLPLIWGVLKPGGILFLNGTPNRHFPLEMHTTGLPVINYLPDRLAHFITCRFSRRNLENDSWESLLRAGIRGGTIEEVVANLPYAPALPVVLDPQYLGIHDRIDLWLALTSQSIGRSSSPTALLAKRLYRLAMKPVKALTGIEFLPELALALQKPASLLKMPAHCCSDS